MGRRGSMNSRRSAQTWIGDDWLQAEERFELGSGPMSWARITNKGCQTLFLMEYTLMSHN
jgi:hypothetical protein